ncbi:hypothetical protein [Alteromonas australica]|uniref:hypothetical protein n=1 Tax=Alteromonas australica TaxID=589873 RepID=UPI000C8BB932|nr:hypothetical protein [Alteromonas australica]MAD45502.1 hypothetical protein [Oceanospirillaceae bacterium]|tara:strand:- start:938 stop:1879 length:942 start_codon:yes stop_codon:yes gene_type:complete
MDDLKSMQRQLDDALKLLDNNDVSNRPDGESTNSLNHLQLNEAKSLIERCEKALEESRLNTKPTIRVIHHLACSGGTLVSKCLAALPNVFLLSELHPTSKLHMGGGKPKFLPADVITQARYANVPDIDALAWKIFVNNIKTTENHVSRLGGHLVIREHTHSDFCVGDSFEKKSSVVEHLSSEFNVLRVATLRDPIDSYLSLLSNNWEHFEPKGFAEYCKRVNTFISEYTSEQVFKYEDFVEDPKESIQKIAKVLDLPFSDSFLDTFDILKVTGDSGRSSDTISPRSRREISKDLSKEMKNERHYKILKEKFNY